MFDYINIILCSFRDCYDLPKSFSTSSLYFL